MSLRESVSPPAYQVHSEHNAMALMRDGVRLAADVHRPARNGQPLDEPLPVLLHRTPYNKSVESRVLEASFFASRGYVTVVQDTRGRYASDGRFTKYVDEGNDGYDTLQWLAQQSWCNGKVGTFGLSYAAHTQAALACLNPPQLACMWMDSGGFSNAFLTGCRNGDKHHRTSPTRRLDCRRARGPRPCESLDLRGREREYHSATIGLRPGSARNRLRHRGPARFDHPGHGPKGQQPP